MKKHLNRSLLLLMALSLFACKADVELTEVDPTVKVNFGAALPVGEISMKLGDFLGDNLDFGDNVIVREDGVLCFYDSINMQYGIDEVDVTQYFEPAHAELRIDSLIPNQLIAVAAMLGIPAHWKLPGSDKPIVLESPIDLSLGGINTPGASQRIDSAIITLAEFYGRISVEHMDMPFDKIESVELILDPRMKPIKDSIVLAQLDGKDYGQNVPIVLENRILDLVKDHGTKVGFNNVVDSLHMKLRFTLSLEKTDTVTIYTDSKFIFDFSINQFDYDAVFGYFNTDGLDDQHMEISFEDLLPIMDQLGSFKMPFADPRIDLAVTTGIGAPLAINIKEISTTDRKSGQKAYATFNGSHSTELFFSNLVWPSDPLDAEATNEFHFSKDPAEGHIDNLFTVEPAKLQFDYNVCIKDTDMYPQMRITDQLNVDVNAEMTMPLEFNKGLELSYTDTMGVEINKISLDSLIANTPIQHLEIDTLYMVVTITNTLPFNIRLELKPMDANGSPVMTMDTVIIAAPSKWDDVNHKLVPGTNKMVISVSEDKLEKLSEVKTMLYTATLCDTKIAEGMQNLPNEAYPIGLGTEGQFSFKIGIAANLEAYLDLSEMSKK